MEMLFWEILQNLLETSVQLDLKNKFNTLLWI